MTFAEETKREAEIMLATKFDERGCISLNLECKLLDGSDGSHWSKIEHSSWNWMNHDYRIIEPPPEPELLEHLPPLICLNRKTAPREIMIYIDKNIIPLLNKFVDLLNEN